MINALQEFMDHNRDVGQVFAKCADIRFGRRYTTAPTDKIIQLCVNYDDATYRSFLEQLNLVYDCGYGAQMLHGTVWWSDGSWSERGEYDGSEWWDHRKCPEIPEELL